MTEEVRFEKYFDGGYQTAYYYDRATGESIWELPKGFKEDKHVLDLTEVDGQTSEAVSVIVPKEDASEPAIKQAEKSAEEQVEQKENKEIELARY